MKKSELIEALYQIEGDPEVFVYVDLHGWDTWAKITDVGTTTLLKMPSITHGYVEKEDWHPTADPGFRGICIQ